MSLERDRTPLPTLISDGDFSLDVEIYGASDAEGVDYTGSEFEISFSPTRDLAPGVGDVHVFNSTGGKVTSALVQVESGVETTVVSLALSRSAGDTTGWKHALHDAEIVMIDGTARTPIYIGTLPVAGGVSEAAGQGAGPFSSSVPGAVKLYVSGRTVQVYRGEASGTLAAAQAARAGAEAARDQANADATATAADRVQTGEDRTQTGEDAAATAADRTAVHDDRVAADADAAATAADRVQTGLDRTQADEDAAATAADRTAVHDDRVAADADAAATAADRVQTGLDRAQTAADRVQTGTDAATTTTKAAAAASSAAAAAASAAGAAVNDTAGAALIFEKAATYDPAATIAQVSATVNRGVENRPAASAVASVGAPYFRRGLLASSSLGAVATFTRTAAATGIDQSGNVFSVASGAPRVSTAGYLSEPAATNVVLWCRDLTNAVWVKSGMTPALDQAGADGTANAASRLTATGAMATCLQAITLASSQRVQSAFVKRLAGAGVVEMTTDGGATWTALSLTAAWSRVSIPVQTLANPSVGFRIQTAGDAIAVDYVQNEAIIPGGYVLVSSPIATTSAAVTRDKDLAFEAVNIPVGQPFTIIGRSIQSPISTSAFLFDLEPASGGADSISLGQNGGTTTLGVKASGYPSISPSNGLTNGAGAPIGFAVSVSGSQVTWSVNGAVARTDNMGAAFGQALTKLYLGCSSVTTGQLGAPLRELNIVMRAMSAAEVQAYSDVSLEESVDFVNAAYQFVGEPFALTELPGVTFSRASTAEAQQSIWLFQSVGANLPRLSDVGLMVEPQRSNLALNNHTPGAYPAPVGGIKGTAGSNFNDFNAVTFTADGTNAQHYQATDVATFANATTYCVSALVNPGGRVQMALPSSIFGPDAYVNFNGVGAGSITAQGAGVASAGIVVNPAGSQFLIWVVAASIAAGTDSAALFSPLSTGAEGRLPALTSAQAIRLDVPQVEAGTYPTSPILTGAALATRNADLLTTAVASPASFSVQAEFTIPKWGPASAPVWRWDDGTSNNFAQLLYDRAAGHLYLQVTTAGVSQANVDLGAVVQGTTYKVAAAIAANDVAVSIGGAAVLTDVSCTVPALTTFRTGTDGTNFWGYGLRKRKRFRGRQSNANLQALAA